MRGQDQDDEVEVEDVLAGVGLRLAAAAGSRASSADEQQGCADAEDRPQPGSGRRSLHQTDLEAPGSTDTVGAVGQARALRRAEAARRRIVAKAADAARPASTASRRAADRRSGGAGELRAGRILVRQDRAGDDAEAVARRRWSRASSGSPRSSSASQSAPQLALDDAAARAVAEDRHLLAERGGVVVGRPLAHLLRAGRRPRPARRSRRGRRAGTPRARRAASPRPPTRRPAATCRAS